MEPRVGVEPTTCRLAREMRVVGSLGFVARHAPWFFAFIRRAMDSRWTQLLADWITSTAHCVGENDIRCLGAWFQRAPLALYGPTATTTPPSCGI